MRSRTDHSAMQYPPVSLGNLLSGIHIVTPLQQLVHITFDTFVKCSGKTEKSHDIFLLKLAHSYAGRGFTPL